MVSWTLWQGPRHWWPALALDISLPLHFLPHDNLLSASSFHSFLNDSPMSSRDQQAAGLQRDSLHKSPVWQIFVHQKHWRCSVVTWKLYYNQLHCSRPKYLHSAWRCFNVTLNKPIAIKVLWKNVVQNCAHHLQCTSHMYRMYFKVLHITTPSTTQSFFGTQLCIKCLKSTCHPLKMFARSAAQLHEFFHSKAYKIKI
jgi:hypothetical protein